MTVSLEQLRRCHVAVDLGAARTRVYIKGLGLVVDEPSAAAINTRSGSLIAVGELAEKMTGRTPDYIRVVRPVSGGSVIDIEMAQRMLRHLLGEKLRRQLRRKRGCAPPPAPRTTAIRSPSAPPSRPWSGSAPGGSSWSTPCLRRRSVAISRSSNRSGA